jgi:uncharacterized membrane protein YjgN (DUF898 family)
MASPTDGPGPEARWPRPATVPAAPEWAAFPPKVSALPETGPPPPPTTAFEIRRLAFYGAGESLFGIHIVNVLLSIVTLGIYRIWARVRVRRYLMSQSAFEGDRFAYHGTGKEIFVGYLKASALFGIPLTALRILPELLGLPEVVQLLTGLLSAALILVFVALAMVGSRRYQLSRTSWRNIRFSFRGRGIVFIKLLVVGWLLSAITLGVYYPVYATRRQAFMTSNSYLGTQRFDFDGQGFDLIWPWIKALLLTFPTLGLCWFWYSAHRQRFFWGHTTVGAARFRYRATGGRLLGLWALNVLLLVGTLGLAWPWTKIRTVDFLCRNLTLEGPLDTAAIVQEADDVSAGLEGLAGLLDTGFDFG